MTRLVSILLFLSLAAFGSKKAIDRILVTVNDDAILESDVTEFINKAKSKSYQELIGIDPAILKDKNAVLKLLVEEKIIDQQVKKLDIKANDQEVEGQIKAIVKRNGITPKQLTDRLAQLGTSMKDYKEGIRRQLERKNLLDREIRPDYEISDEQLKYFYQRNAQPQDAEAEYRIAHILVSSKKSGDAAAKQRVTKIANEAKAAPEKFEALAKEYSDDDSTSETGGALGFFSESSLSKEFKAVVPKTPVGTVAGPIKTSAGYHVLKVLEAKAQDFSSLPKEKKEILRNQMRASELERKMSVWLERKKAEAHIKRFDDDNKS